MEGICKIWHKSNRWKMHLVHSLPLFYKLDFKWSLSFWKLKVSIEIYHYILLLQVIWNCDPRLISQFVRYVTVIFNLAFTESLPYHMDDPKTQWPTQWPRLMTVDTSDYFCFWQFKPLFILIYQLDNLINLSLNYLSTIFIAFPHILLVVMSPTLWAWYKWETTEYRLRKFGNWNWI